MSIFAHCPSVKTYDNPSVDVFENVIKKAHRPAILKGAVAHWGAVKKGKESDEALCQYLDGFASAQDIRVAWGEPEMKGHFFYGDGLVGRNHIIKSYRFRVFADELLRLRQERDPAYIYAGSVPLIKHFTNLIGLCPMPFIDPSKNPHISLWIGNQTTSYAHWDEPKNLACVVAGRRRFTLFPIEQVSNLYFGSFNDTIAGQPISLVDFDNPDFDAFPKFKDAIEAAEIAELEAGDVLYMPNLWIHHVRSLERFGAMINFWWQDEPNYLQSPSDTLIHAIIALKDRSPQEKQQWKTIFDHYIFQDENPLAHLDPSVRGVFGSINTGIVNAGKAMLLNSLNKRT